MKTDVPIIKRGQDSFVTIVRSNIYLIKNIGGLGVSSYGVIGYNNPNGILCQ